MSLHDQNARVIGPFGPPLYQYVVDRANGACDVGAVQDRLPLRGKCAPSTHEGCRSDSDSGIVSGPCDRDRSRLWGGQGVSACRPIRGHSADSKGKAMAILFGTILIRRLTSPDSERRTRAETRSRVLSPRRVMNDPPLPPRPRVTHPSTRRKSLCLLRSSMSE